MQRLIVPSDGQIHFVTQYGLIESIGSRFGKDFKTVEALRTNNWSDFFTRPSFDSKKEVPSIHAMRRVIMNDPEPEHA